jgi:hypothetical protein
LKVKVKVKENTLRNAEVKMEKSRESERGIEAIRHRGCERHTRNAVAGVKVTAKVEPEERNGSRRGGPGKRLRRLRRALQ